MNRLRQGRQGKIRERKPKRQTVIYYEDGSRSGSTRPCPQKNKLLFQRTKRCPIQTSKDERNQKKKLTSSQFPSLTGSIHEGIASASSSPPSTVGYIATLVLLSARPPPPPPPPSFSFSFPFFVAEGGVFDFTFAKAERAFLEDDGVPVPGEAP